MYTIIDDQDPTDSAELWHKIREAYEAMLNDFDEIYGLRYETRKEALDTRYVSVTDPSLIRYRETDDFENLHRFWELGKQLLPKVRQHLESRCITEQFFYDWSKLVFCHGFVVPSAFALDNDMKHRRDVARGGQAVSVNAQRKWVAHLIAHQQLRYPDRPRSLVEVDVAAGIRRLLEDERPLGFPKEWFAKILKPDGQLKRTYREERLSDETIQPLIREPLDGLPSVDIEIPVPRSGQLTA